MDELVLEADIRTAMGKKNRALRAAGIIPIHVYGLDDAPASLQVSLRQLISVVRAAGRTSPVIIKSDKGSSDVTLVRDVATHPVSGDVLHVDFLRVDPDRNVEAPVPVFLINQDLAPGIRGGAGFVTQGIYEVTLSARPGSIPQQIEADCIVLESLDHSILASDLVLPEGVTLVSDEDDRIAWVQPPRVIEDEEEALEGEIIEGEEAEASVEEEPAE